MPSPFPGMDPYLEAAPLWPGFQQQFVTCLYQLLLPNLADRYNPRPVRRTYHTEIVLFTSIIREEHVESFVEIRRRTDSRLVTLIDVEQDDDAGPGGLPRPAAAGAKRGSQHRRDRSRPAGQADARLPARGAGLRLHGHGRPCRPSGPLRRLSHHPARAVEESPIATGPGGRRPSARPAAGVRPLLRPERLCQADRLCRGPAGPGGGGRPQVGGRAVAAAEVAEVGTSPARSASERGGWTSTSRPSLALRAGDVMR